MNFPISPQALLQAIREGRRLLAEAGEESGPFSCPTCQAPAQFEATFCTDCGSRLRFPCPHCQKTCLAGRTYCAHCGEELEEELVGQTVKELQEEAQKERRLAQEDVLLRYRETRVLESHHVEHRLGLQPDGTKDFLKIARSKSGRTLLQNEIDMIQAIGPHPGVLRLLETQDRPNQLVAVLEQIESEPLRFPLSIPRLLRIASKTLKILEYVHGQGVVHADLKPAHILLRAEASSELQPVLIDWNVAQKPGPSRFGAFTALFSAPEQIVGDHLDHRVDLYALGVIIYLLFTHDRFPNVLEESREAEPMLQVLKGKKVKNRAFLDSKTMYMGNLSSLSDAGEQNQHQDSPSRDPYEERRVLGAKYLFSSELRRTHTVNAEIRLTGKILAIVQKATATEPEDRYPSARAMRGALEELLEQCPPEREVTDAL